MQSTLKQCMRIGVVLTRCSLSSIMETGRVSSPTKVSLSLVVRKILDSFSLSTLHMMSRAAWSCVAESQESSLDAPFLGFPRPRAAGAVDDFSAAFVSTAATVHWRRKP